MEKGEGWKLRLIVSLRIDGKNEYFLWIKMGLGIGFLGLFLPNTFFMFGKFLVHGHYDMVHALDGHSKGKL